MMTPNPGSPLQQSQRIGTPGTVPPHLQEMNSKLHAMAAQTAQKWRPMLQEMVEDGASLRTIAVALWDHGARTRGGQPLDPSSVRRLLRAAGLQTRAAAVSATAWAESLRAPVLELQEAGASVLEMVAALNAAGHRTRNGKPLQRAAIQSLLRRLRLARG